MTPHRIVMKYAFKKDPNLKYFFISLAGLFGGLILCLVWLRGIALEHARNAVSRYEAINLASELRHSSDDLTEMVQRYVSTGKKKYRDYYHEILTIRDGTTPRPLNYEQIYWELVTDDHRPRPYGTPLSLKAKIYAHNFTYQEFSLLETAEARSQKLTNLELRAMNAMEGKFQDPSGDYTIKGKPDPELARKIIFSDEYMYQKYLIMSPIQKFYEILLKRMDTTSDELNKSLTSVAGLTLLLAIIATGLMLLSIYKILRSLSKANLENDLLLLNIFPTSIASRLKHGEEDIAEEFTQASIMFADIVNFTQLTESLGAKKIVNILNELFESFDNLTEIYKVEKVKTIGDNYMAVSGVPEPSIQHAVSIATYALALLDKLHEFNKTHNMNLQLRIGMSCGGVIAGIIGHKKFLYDVWGKVVNLASRLETHAQPNKILVSEKMAFMLEEDFILEPHEVLDIKGIGEVSTYYLIGRKLKVTNNLDAL